MRLALCLCLALVLSACMKAPPPYTGGEVPVLQSIDTQVGQGAVAKSGDRVNVHYTGWIHEQSAADKHGSEFDSSLKRGKPFSFVLGAGQVIRGWDEGVAGMRIGGKRTLLIPPSEGYGDKGAGSAIPPNAALVFDVELVGIE